MQKIVLVTGANKGIGYEVVKNLAQREKKFLILLGSRSADNAKEALSRLQKETDSKDLSHVTPIIVDLNDEKSIQSAAETVKKDYGGLDILINNAGMAWKGSAFDETVARTTIATNYHGTHNLCKHFFPLMRENGRVVNVSSMAGTSALNKMSKDLRGQFLDDSLTKEKLDGLMAKFTSDVGKGTWKEDGWPESCYGMSKAGLSMLTRIQARENKTKGLLINAACPGWCRTDMAGPKAMLSPDEGARRLIVSALLPEDCTITGEFWEKGEKSSWPEK